MCAEIESIRIFVAGHLGVQVFIPVGYLSTGLYTIIGGGGHLMVTLILCKHEFDLSTLH